MTPNDHKEALTQALYAVERIWAKCLANPTYENIHAHNEAREQHYSAVDAVVRELDQAREQVERLSLDIQQMTVRPADGARCAECDALLEEVRPGKHQHPDCPQAPSATVEAWAAIAELTDDARVMDMPLAEAIRAVAQPAASVEPSNFEEAFDEARDTVLHGRHQLEGTLDNDQTNAVLDVLDQMYDDSYAETPPKCHRCGHSQHPGDCVNVAPVAAQPQPVSGAEGWRDAVIAVVEQYGVSRASEYKAANYSQHEAAKVESARLYADFCAMIPVAQPIGRAQQDAIDAAPVAAQAQPTSGGCELPNGLVPNTPNLEYLRSITDNNNLPAYMRAQILAAVRQIEAMAQSSALAQKRENKS